MLELKDISLVISSPDEQKVLLRDITLQFPLAHFTAVIGPSGCGKSTLLKTIAGLTEPTEGEVFWEGRDLAEEDFNPADIGYIPQFSIAYDYLDVWESVYTTACLRIGGVSKHDLMVRTEQILHEVGLDTIMDRRVKVLSGGQKRRLALALEMVTQPKLLLADEVTSGLDPKAEKEVVQLLYKVSREEKCTVLNVTHSLSHLNLHDSVLVLYEGYVAYHGPTRYLLHYFDVSSAEEVFPRLTRKRAESWHTSWQKHREHYLKQDEMLDKEISEKEKQQSAQAEVINLEKPDTTEENPSKNDISEKEEKEIKDAEKEDIKNNDKDDKKSLDKELPGLISQFLTLLHRRFRIFFRDRGQLWLHIALIFGFPCLVVIFAMHGLPDIKSLDTAPGMNLITQIREQAQLAGEASKTGGIVSGLIMFQVILLTLMGANNSAREIAGERLIFEKEKLGGVHPGSYVLSKAVFLLFIVVLQSVWMGVFVKAICNFPGDLFAQVTFLMMVNAAMTSICLAISSLVRSSEQASLLSIYLVGFQLPLSGAILALPDFLNTITRPFIAAYWSWSGIIQTMRSTKFYDAVLTVSPTPLSGVEIGLWILGCHIIIGLFLTYVGTQRSRWE